MNLQNTYRLEPHVPFHQDKCDLVVKQVIDEAMEEFQYNAKQAPILCKALTEELKKRVKELTFDRYKLICTVTIGERFLQSIKSTVKILWDADRDGFSSYSYDTPQFFCAAAVYAIYFD